MAALGRLEANPVNTIYAATVLLACFGGGLLGLLLGVGMALTAWDALTYGFLARKPVPAIAWALAYVTASAGSFYGAAMSLSVVFG